MQKLRIVHIWHWKVLSGAMRNDGLYSKPCLKHPLKRRRKICLDWLSLIARQKICRILSTCIKLPAVFKTFVFPIFEWPLKKIRLLYVEAYLV